MSLTLVLAAVLAVIAMGCLLSATTKDNQEVRLWQTLCGIWTLLASVATAAGFGLYP